MALPARSPPTIETLGTAYGEAQRSVEDLTANAAWISVQGTDFPRRRADPPLKKKILARRQKILDNHKHLTYSATFQRWAWDEKSLVAETIDEACRLPTLDRHSDTDFSTGEYDNYGRPNGNVNHHVHLQRVLLVCVGDRRWPDLFHKQIGWEGSRVYRAGIVPNPGKSLQTFSIPCH